MIANVEVTPFDYVNFTCKKGDSFEKEIEVLNADEGPFDFTGYTATMIVRKREGSEAIETFDTTDSSIVLTAGEIALSKASITANSGNYVYDLQITKDGRNTTLITGNFYIRPDYT